MLRAQLGRPARGVVGIAARCVCGNPTVAATAPRLDDGTPFPTFYYLTHPAATAAMSALEAGQVMRTLSDDLAADRRSRRGLSARPRGVSPRPRPIRRGRRDRRHLGGRDADARQVPARSGCARARRGSRRQSDRRPCSRAVVVVSAALRVRRARGRRMIRPLLAASASVLAVAAADRLRGGARRARRGPGAGGGVLARRVRHRVRMDHDARRRRAHRDHRHRDRPRTGGVRRRRGGRHGRLGYRLLTTAGLRSAPSTATTAAGSPRWRPRAARVRRRE